MFDTDNYCSLRSHTDSKDSSTYGRKIHTNTLRDRYTQLVRQREKQTQTKTQIEPDKQRHRYKERLRRLGKRPQTDRETDTHPKIDRDTHSLRQRQEHTEKNTHTQTHRHTHTNTHTHTHFHTYVLPFSGRCY